MKIPSILVEEGLQKMLIAISNIEGYLMDRTRLNKIGHCLNLVDKKMFWLSHIITFTTRNNFLPLVRTKRTIFFP
jgi:hypothetical protein